MTSMPWPNHLLTLEEWDELSPLPGWRMELSEGVVVVVPKPAALHQRAMLSLGAVVDRQLPPDLIVLPDVEVVIAAGFPPTVRAPDVVVTSTAVAEGNPSRLDAADVVLAVEIVSPGTQRTDRVTKLAEYAEAGIPHYWVVDLEGGPHVVAHLLVDGTYELAAEGSGRITVLTPVPLEVDVASLVTRRPL